ncbi:MAG: hypothetical protein ACRDRJ_37320 [Streptosporangiaceae bacterium]
MTRETVGAKAARYLAEDRLVVDLVNGDRVTAWCRGDGAVYRLGHDLGRGWYCDCPARADCAHLAALRLVTTTRGHQAAGGGMSPLRSDEPAICSTSNPGRTR